MTPYENVANEMASRKIKKAVVGDYIIYNREWLYEQLESEFELLKRGREFNKNYLKCWEGIEHDRTHERHGSMGTDCTKDKPNGTPRV